MGTVTATPAALDLIASYRLPVFPCGAGKKPTSPHGFKDATRDCDRAISLWRDGAPFIPLLFVQSD